MVWEAMNFLHDILGDIPQFSFIAFRYTHEIVHSFPNHPLKKFIAYLPCFIAYLPYFIAYLTYFIAYLTCFIAYLTCFIAYLTWIISFQIIQKRNENTVNIVHSLLTIDHSFPNHPLQIFIAFQTTP